jgi:hypothetical protein
MSIKPFLFALCAALGLSMAAPQAQADTFGLHVVSVHIPKNDYNNVNPGFYYRMDSGWTAGFYRNSIRNESFYAGYTLNWYFLDVTVGGVTGYTDPVQILVVPSISFPQSNNARLRLAYIPRVEKRIDSHVIHLMAEYKF